MQSSSQQLVSEKNSEVVRARVLRGFRVYGAFIGIQLTIDVRKGEEAFISYPHSPVKVMVIPTNEEVMIARDVTRLAKPQYPSS